MTDFVIVGGEGESQVFDVRSESGRVTVVGADITGEVRIQLLIDYDGVTKAKTISDGNGDDVVFTRDFDIPIKLQRGDRFKIVQSGGAQDGYFAVNGWFGLP